MLEQPPSSEGKIWLVNIEGFLNTIIKLKPFSLFFLSILLHPKAKEIIYAETCLKAHRPDTGYWVKY